MTEYLHIKYIPTGNCFEIPKKEAEEILKNDRGNYEVLDEGYVEETADKNTQTSLYNKIVIGSEDETEQECDNGTSEGESKGTDDNPEDGTEGDGETPSGTPNSLLSKLGLA